MSDFKQRHIVQRALVATAAILIGTGALAQVQPKTTAAKPKTSQAKPKPKAKASTPAAPVATAPAAATAAAVATNAASPSTPEQRPADYIVALVNSEPITNNELLARLARARQQLAERNERAPSEAMLREQVLDVFISERAQLQLAKEMNIEADELTLEQAEASIAQQNNLPSVQALHTALRREGVTVDNFRQDLRQQIALQRLRDRMIEPRVKVTDSDIDRFVNEQMAQQGIQNTPEINLAMILVRVPENSTAADISQLRQRADDVAKRAKSGEDFAKLASEYSQSINQGQDGGELGLRSVDKYPALFTNATNALPVGGVTDVVQSDAGFHVLKVIERKKGTIPTITVPQTHARHILLTVNSAQDEAQALQRLRDFKRRIETGQADFATLARDNSKDASASEGGDLGWANPGQFVPEFEQVMNGLEPGQIGEPVRSRFGLHLIQVLARREHSLTEADQRAVARNILRERKAAEEFATWAKEVRGRAFVEMRDEPH